MTDRLHERMHEIPGMPDHASADRNNSHTLHSERGAGQNRPHIHATAHHGHPRVFVKWQRFIADLGRR
jgi:hypothetical protein